MARQDDRLTVTHPQLLAICGADSRMAICGANVRHFSGISARKGGLSTAITAGITEEILFLQSGHGQARAARNYIHLQDPARLFDTFRAFGL